LSQDQVSSGIWILVSGILALASLQYNLGTLSSPGSGFLPFLSALAMGAFSLVGFIHASVRKNGGPERVPILKGVRWEKAFIVLASLFAYGWLLGVLGFVLCTFLFLAFLLRVVAPQKWAWVVGGSFLITVASYLVFEVLLRAQMPKGVWGF
jgi:hypothetical protein